MAALTHPAAPTPTPGAVRANPAVRTTPVPAVWLVLLAAPLALSANSPALILPNLADSFGLSVATVSWLVTVFGWAVALGTPLMGGLARRRGLRTTLWTGAVCTAAGTLAVAVAPWFPLLAAGRAAQAFGGAGLVAVAMNLAGGSTRRMGVITASFGVLGATGPLVGSLVTGAGTWHLVFAIQAVTLVAVPFAARHLSASAGPGTGGERFDGTGAGLLAVVVTALVSVPHLPLAALAVLAAAVPLLALHLRRRPDGFVPVALLRSRAFPGAAGLTFAQSTVYFALLYAVPRLFDASWSRGAVGVGQMLALMTGSALSFVLANAAGRLPRGTVPALLVALSGTAVAIAVLTSWSPLLFLTATLAVLAGSTGQAVLGVRAVTAAPVPALRPVAIGLFQLAFQLGGAFGPTITVLLLG